jgi:hypothetical protein
MKPSSGIFTCINTSKAWMPFCCKILKGQQKTCQFQKLVPVHFKWFTECEKMNFKARLQRIGSFEVLIQVKIPDEGFVGKLQLKL